MASYVVRTRIATVIRNNSEIQKIRFFPEIRKGIHAEVSSQLFDDPQLMLPCRRRVDRRRMTRPTQENAAAAGK